MMMVQLMTKNIKSLLIIALWFICGNLTWLSASYFFNRGTSYLIPPTLNFMRTVLHLSFGTSYIAFLLYTISDLIIVFFIVFLLSRATGKRNIWLLMFIVGAIGFPLYYTIRNHIVMYHDKLPVWDTLIPALTAKLIIIPLLSWLGAILAKPLSCKT